MDNEIISSDIDSRTYGYNTGRNIVGTDPQRYIIKSFDDDMYSIASYLYSLIYFNRVKFKLLKYNVTYKFNHCTILNHHADDNIKIRHI